MTGPHGRDDQLAGAGSRLGASHFPNPWQSGAAVFRLPGGDRAVDLAGAARRGVGLGRPAAEADRRGVVGRARRPACRVLHPGRNRLRRHPSRARSGRHVRLGQEVRTCRSRRTHGRTPRGPRRGPGRGRLLDLGRGHRSVRRAGRLEQGQRRAGRVAPEVLGGIQQADRRVRRPHHVRRGDGLPRRLRPRRRRRAAERTEGVARRHEAGRSEPRLVRPGRRGGVPRRPARRAVVAGRAPSGRRRTSSPTSRDSRAPRRNPGPVTRPGAVPPRIPPPHSPPAPRSTSRRPPPPGSPTAPPCSAPVPPLRP